MKNLTRRQGQVKSPSGGASGVTFLSLQVQMIPAVAFWLPLRGKKLLTGPSTLKP